MSNSNQFNGDNSLMELFISEIVSHTSALESGLINVGLINAGEPPTAESIEPLTQAAHSIKGAAQIMGFAPIVELSHSIEDLFSSVQHSKLQLSQPVIDAFLKSNNFLKSIAEVQMADIPQFISDNIGIINELLQNLQQSIEINDLAEKDPFFDNINTTQKSEPATKSVKAEKKPAHPQRKSPEATTAQSFSIDPFMLDLFIIELENHTRALEEGLVEVESKQTRENIEPLMRAAHSIKGAARIIGLNDAVELAHKMEDMLSAAMNAKFTLNADVIDLLLKGNDIYRELSMLDKSTIANEVVKKSKEMSELASIIDAALKGEPIPQSNNIKKAKPQESPDNELQPNILITEIDDQVIPIEETEKMVSSDQTAEAKSLDQRIQSDRAAQSSEKSKSESFVRVLSDSLNRIIGLSGETLVLSKSTRQFTDGMQRSKTIHYKINTELEQLISQESDDWSVDKFRSKAAELVEISSVLSQELNSQLDTFEQFSIRMDNLTDRLYRELIESRMRPFSDGLHGFQRMVRDLAKSLQKKVTLEIKGASTKVDRDILEKLESPLTHIVRNAVDHGMEMPEERLRLGKSEEGCIILEARHSFGMLNIIVSDDGCGINEDNLRRKIVEKGYVTDEMAAELNGAELYDFLFLPGFSTAKVVTQISGRGVGLDVVHSMVQEVGGSIRIDSKPNEGTSFNLQLPITLSVQSTLMVEISGEYYAFPLTRIDSIMLIKEQDIEILENRQYCKFGDENIGVISASHVLQLPEITQSSDELPIIIISDRLNRYGIVVDRFLNKHDLSVIPLDSRLGKIPNISAGAILDDGSPVVIFDVDDLVRSIDNILSKGSLKRVGHRFDIAALKKKCVLVVDDSITVREVERKLLENRGYFVTVAVDGVDGWNTLQTAKFDLVLSDIDMPRMNGIEFVSKIKSHPEYRDIPVMIVSYKDREEDRILGLEAGADYYLTKSSFHDESLINAVRDLIGDAT